MVGTYPLIIEGRVCGKLKVEKDGAYTRFVAECPMQRDVIRLSVYGDGKEGYLGVPLPCGDGLRLEKKLSRAAMRDFPAVFDHCAPAGESSEQEEKTAEAVCEEELCEKTEPICACEPEKQQEHECQAGDDMDEEGPFWYATTDGALVSRDGETEMVALSPDDERVPRDIPGQPRIIEGKEYLVYITKEM